jgi:hypothetical protein
VPWSVQTLLPKALIASFLNEFSVDPQNIKFQAKDLANFIGSTTESFLQEWDVVIPQGSGEESLLGSIKTLPTKRSVRVYPNTNSVLISGKSARIASPGIEQEGLPADLVASLIAKYKQENPGKTVPDLVFRKDRPRPLLLIYVVKPLVKGNDSGIILPDLIALGLSFRDFDDSDVAKQVEYRINLVESRGGEIEDEAEEEDGDDELD